MNETRLFIGNIPPNTSESELKSEFAYYGAVKSVELKKKSEDNFYGFVNIEIEEKLLQKCIREFSQQKFNGNYLSVSKAKESFLDRLKKEREQQDRIGGENSIGRRLIEMSMKSNTELEMDRTAQLPRIEKEVSSDESSSEESEKEEIEKPKISIRRITFDTPSMVKEEETKILDKATLDDMKRQQSFQKLQQMHREQKNAIRNALSAIDSTTPRNNKIVFEKPEPIEKSIEKNKPILFDSDEEIEVQPESFKIKKQFDGKKGERLFELQTKFNNDTRFKMDEKFAENTDDFIDSRKKYAREELKERKRLRKEMTNWDQDELKEERDHQLSILEGITGQATGVMSSNMNLKSPQKGMLRFDPSKKSHQKYLDVVKGDEDVEDDDDAKIKDFSKTSDNEKDDKTENERYFEVADNLASAFKSNNQSFSIFGMLGINHQDNYVNDDETKTHEEASEIKTVKLPTKLQAFEFNQARFKYDSSDTDEENAKSTKKFKKEPQKKSKDGKYSKSGVWRHNFFVCDGDKRLKEAFAFLKKADYIQPEMLQEKRKKLKKVIKSQVRKAKQDKGKEKSKKRKV